MNSVALPSPSDFPQADVVVFDGQCQFCRRQVARLHRWDGGHRLAFISLHDANISRYTGELTHEQLMEQMYVVNQRGARYGGAAAIRYLSRRLPRLWLLAPLIHLPFTLPLFQSLYRQLARRRYQFNQDSCDSGTCPVHFK